MDKKECLNNQAYLHSASTEIGQIYSLSNVLFWENAFFEQYPSLYQEPDFLEAIRSLQQSYAGTAYETGLAHFLSSQGESHSSFGKVEILQEQASLPVKDAFSPVCSTLPFEEEFLQELIPAKDGEKSTLRFWIEEGEWKHETLFIDLLNMAEPVRNTKPFSSEIRYPFVQSFLKKEEDWPSTRHWPERFWPSTWKNHFHAFFPYKKMLETLASFYHPDAMFLEDMLEYPPALDLAAKDQSRLLLTWHSDSENLRVQRFGSKTLDLHFDPAMAQSMKWLNLAFPVPEGYIDVEILLLGFSVKTEKRDRLHTSSRRTTNPVKQRRYRCLQGKAWQEYRCSASRLQREKERRAKKDLAFTRMQAFAKPLEGTGLQAQKEKQAQKVQKFTTVRKGERVYRFKSFSWKEKGIHREESEWKKDEYLHISFSYLMYFKGSRELLEPIQQEILERSLYYDKNRHFPLNFFAVENCAPIQRIDLHYFIKRL